jgi:hypothetical protein
MADAADTAATTDKCGTRSVECGFPAAEGKLHLEADLIWKPGDQEALGNDCGTRNARHGGLTRCELEILA